MEKVKANKVLFIKLGEKGEFEKECITKNQTLRLSFHEVDHELCKNKEWEKVKQFYLTEANKSPSTATKYKNQIQWFYEEDEKTLWITFYLNRMWWCFSRPEITLLPDNTKTRPVIGKWSDKDINGNILFSGNLSGKLLKTQGFRGTICSVGEEKYALAKINGERLKEVSDVEDALKVFKKTLTILINKLQWKDFEALVDLIFRQAGWQRVGELGKTQKTIDLDLFAPVTGERAVVQIKSQSNLDEFLNYQTSFSEMKEYDQFYFVVNNSEENLRAYKNVTKTKILFVEQVAELAISAGLVDWVIKKTS